MGTREREEQADQERERQEQDRQEREQMSAPQMMQFDDEDGTINSPVIINK